MSYETNQGTTLNEDHSEGPGLGAALIAFVLFIGIAAASVALARRQGTLYDDGVSDGQAVETPGTGSVDVQVIMNHRRYYSDSQALRGADLVTIAGRGFLDLSGAKMQGDVGNLDVVVLAGAAVVKVPPDWAVVSADNVAAMGAIQNEARRAEGPNVKKVHLDAFVLMGRLDVVH